MRVRRQEIGARMCNSDQHRLPFAFFTKLRPSAADGNIVPTPYICLGLPA